MEMSFDEIKRDITRLETMKAEYQSLAGSRASVGTSRSRGLEKGDQKDLTRKRDAIECFEHEFRTKVACFKGAVKVSDLPQMNTIRKLKDNYGFEGSVLISKYVSFREREDIKLQACPPACNGDGDEPIEWFEESDRQSPFEDHWTVRK